MTQKITGSWTPDKKRLENLEAQCPFQCEHHSASFWGCARWGSATPYVVIHKCTVADLQECPLSEWPTEPSIIFWKYWIKQKNKLAAKTK